MHITSYYILLKRKNINVGFFRFVYSFVSSTLFDNRLSGTCRSTELENGMSLFIYSKFIL